MDGAWLEAALAQFHDIRLDLGGNAEGELAGQRIVVFDGHAVA